ncbi:MAG: hypothetical protein WBV94_21710 [Blastocatellia bacterium]
MAKKKAIYIGNLSTKEFHCVKAVKPECNAGEIAKPVEFRRGRDARKAGFDACAHCNTYWKSRDNK